VSSARTLSDADIEAIADAVAARLRPKSVRAVPAPKSPPVTRRKPTELEMAQALRDARRLGLVMMPRKR
jgi:hypothetical protein